MSVDWFVVWFLLNSSCCGHVVFVRSLCIRKHEFAECLQTCFFFGVSFPLEAEKIKSPAKGF